MTKALGRHYAYGMIILVINLLLTWLYAQAINGATKKEPVTKPQAAGFHCTFIWMYAKFRATPGLQQTQWGTCWLTISLLQTAWGFKPAPAQSWELTDNQLIVGWIGTTSGLPAFTVQSVEPTNNQLNVRHLSLTC